MTTDGYRWLPLTPNLHLSINADLLVASQSKMDTSKRHLQALGDHWTHEWSQVRQYLTLFPWSKMVSTLSNISVLSLTGEKRQMPVTMQVPCTVVHAVCFLCLPDGGLYFCSVATW